MLGQKLWVMESVTSRKWLRIARKSTKTLRRRAIQIRAVFEENELAHELHKAAKKLSLTERLFLPRYALPMVGQMKREAAGKDILRLKFLAYYLKRATRIALGLTVGLISGTIALSLFNDPESVRNWFSHLNLEGLLIWGVAGIPLSAVGYSLFEAFFEGIEKEHEEVMVVMNRFKATVTRNLKNLMYTRDIEEKEREKKEKAVVASALLLESALERKAKILIEELALLDAATHMLEGIEGRTGRM